MITNIDQQIRKRMRYNNGDPYWTKCKENLRCYGKKAGSVSYAKVVKDNLPDVDLEQYRGKPSSFWKIT